MLFTLSVGKEVSPIDLGPTKTLCSVRLPLAKHLNYQYHSILELKLSLPTYEARAAYIVGSKSYISGFQLFCVIVCVRGTVLFKPAGWLSPLNFCLIIFPLSKCWYRSTSRRWNQGRHLWGTDGVDGEAKHCGALLSHALQPHGAGELLPLKNQCRHQHFAMSCLLSFADCSLAYWKT